MPTYCLACSQCNHKYEIFQGITQKLPRKCPQCKANTVEQVFAGCSPTIVTYGNIDTVTTVGQAAELNEKRLGKELMQQKIEDFQQSKRRARQQVLKLPQGAEKIKASRETPWWRPEGSKPKSMEELSKDPAYKEVIDTLDKSPLPINKGKK